jgi:hypothetical protein
MVHEECQPDTHRNRLASGASPERPESGGSAFHWATLEHVIDPHPQADRILVAQLTGGPLPGPVA